ncbi:MAG: GDSL-type esterase/lipase family protein [Spirochaetaceae bacterium]|jgi:lysophospholipase L1-like esterase|nr:GDSL-type esterase/lipase family protein [Spirochaetaceae bacterium]
MRKMIASVFAACIVAVTGCATAGTGQPPAETQAERAAETPGNMPIPAVSADDPAVVPVSRSDPWWIDRHTERTNPRYNQKIIFIGDSITQGWEGTEAWTALNQTYQNAAVNLGFSGDQTQHALWRLENGEFPPGIQPEYAVILIGTNNNDAPDAIAAGIGKIIQIIHANSPETNILLLSLLPRGIGGADANTLRNNAVNEIIRKYDGFLRVTYLDIAQYYVNPDGTLKEELFTDRLHLTEAGYEVWKETLMEVIGN